MDIKETIECLMNEFRKRAECHALADSINDLTDKLLLIVDVAKQNQSLDYYKNALIDIDFVIDDNVQIKQNQTVS